MTSSTPRGDSEPRTCAWCRLPLEVEDQRALYCGQKCRQAAYRFRRQTIAEALDDASLRLAYADPPYPGLAHRYYSREESYAGEVDHVRLLEQLATGYDGWALSTSRKALRDVLPLVPRWVDVYVCPWLKTHHEPNGRGPVNVHEYVLVKPARLRLPGPRDALVAAVARGGDSDLMGRKPLKFVAWLFDLLGAQPQDSLDDLFPGSGVVGRCWDEFRRPAPADGGAK